ncbi:MAG: prepilin-type N-terminal cleavage/methylation domain-containing protein [Candidatus Margulisiibacteriota bacterium]
MKRGFTLVEAIIALSLTALIFTVIFGALGTGVRSWRLVVRKNALAQIETNLAERVTIDIRSASAVLCGSTSQEVFLQVGSENVNYRLVDGKVRRRAGSWSAYLTSEGEIGRLTFSYPEPGLIRIALNKAEFTVGVR